MSRKLNLPSNVYFLTNLIKEMNIFDNVTDTEISTKIDSIKTDSTEKLVKITTDIEDIVEVNKALLTRVSKSEKLKGSSE